jgi:hypothetical protein
VEIDVSGRKRRLVAKHNSLFVDTDLDFVSAVRAQEVGSAAPFD